MKKKFVFLGVLLASGFLLTACSNGQSQNQEHHVSTSQNNSKTDSSSNGNSNTANDDLQIRFGRSGNNWYRIEMANNKTARGIASTVSDTSWNLPIYTYKNYKHDDVLQYYEVSEEYQFASNPQHITSEKAGEIYYQKNTNRVILFFNNANVPGNYTYVGKIKNTNGLADAVKNNPKVKGWDNTIVSVKVIK